AVACADSHGRQEDRSLTVEAQSYLGQLVRAAGLTRLGAVIALAITASLIVSAQSLGSLVDRYHEHPTPHNHVALMLFADAHSKTRTGALALFALSYLENENRDFDDAAKHGRAASKRIPLLADYGAYFAASADSALQKFGDIEQTLAPVWNRSPQSPLMGQALVLRVNALLANGNAAKAASLLKTGLPKEASAGFPPSQAELLMGKAAEASSDLSHAIAHYQLVYTQYPLSGDARDAQDALNRLHVAPTPEALLKRSLRLVDIGDYGHAEHDLEALLPRLSEEQANLARVRIGLARFEQHNYQSAYDYLRSFATSEPAADAERLSYLAQTAFRLNRESDGQDWLAQIATKYPHSKWRLKALIAGGNYYLLSNRTALYEPLYRACYEIFPDDPQAPYCHWKVAWAEYLMHRGDAKTWFEDHLHRYPKSEKATTALYFLGRIAENANERGSARVYYEKIVRTFPNYYYAILARKRLAVPAVHSAARSAETAEFLMTLAIDPERDPVSFDPNPSAKLRIERARLLSLAGLDDLAAAELQFGANADGQPQIMAMELASLASHNDQPDRGIRMIKHYAPGYLEMPLTAAPQKFWRLAFPLPYRHSIDVYSHQHGLDPFLVAALIRQESEFNPKAISYANAHGLTQVMPSTGRALSRTLRIRRFKTNMLLRPDINLKIGTYYLKTQLDELQGKWDATLASYNAGKTRVIQWLGWGPFEEPAEFVETIPFTQTRNYVQSVLRKADLYRRLYQPESAEFASKDGNGHAGSRPSLP
ncbi:MAG: transglycosylase SLT domain-containing protein, partial [Bryobacteraceae bacterium]